MVYDVSTVMCTTRETKGPIPLLMCTPISVGILESVLFLKKKKKKTKNRLFKSGISEFAPKIFSYEESWQHTLYSSQGVN